MAENETNPVEDCLGPVEPVPREPRLPAVRLWIWLTLLALTVGLYLILQKTNKPDEDWARAPEGEKAPDALIEGFRLVSTFRGAKQWELYARQARLYQETKKAYADDIYVQYFRKGKIVSTLTADKGVIQTETQDTSAEGHVELIAENGAKLSTDRLKWVSDTEVITTDSRVHILKGTDDITATGMEAVISGISPWLLLHSSITLVGLSSLHGLTREQNDLSTNYNRIRRHVQEYNTGHLINKEQDIGSRLDFLFENGCVLH